MKCIICDLDHEKTGIEHCLANAVTSILKLEYELKQKDVEIEELKRHLAEFNSHDFILTEKNS